MFGFGQLIEILKKDPKKIVFTEGEDPRILEAASRLLASNFLHPILVGDPEKISASAEKSGFNIRGAEIIDPMNFDRMDEMVELFCELRKSKGVTPEQAKLSLIHISEPKRQINIHPTEDELVEIAGETAECAKIFGIDPKVAFLSYSTLGSGKGEDVDKMRNAAHKAMEKYPNLPIEGELQFDAAVAPRVARTKCPDSVVAGHANTFIFPDINAGNIGYKIAQRMGNFEAYGPILLGLNAPINDLSRGCNAGEVYSMAIITAALA